MIVFCHDEDVLEDISGCERLLLISTTDPEKAAGAFLDSGIAKSAHGLLVLTTYRSCKQLIAMLDAIDDDSFREFEALCARTLLSE